MKVISWDNIGHQFKVEFELRPYIPDPASVLGPPYGVKYWVTLEIVIDGQRYQSYGAFAEQPTPSMLREVMIAHITHNIRNPFLFPSEHPTEEENIEMLAVTKQQEANDKA